MADEIPAPVAHFRAEATEFFAVLAKMHAETDRTTTGIAGKAKLMSDAFKARVDEIAAKNNGLLSSMAKVASQAGVMGVAVAAGAVVGGVALAEFAKHGVEDFLKLTDAVIKFQRVSGATAQESSQLVAVSRVLGVSSDATALSIYRLGVNVTTHADKLKADGIEIARNKAGHVDLAATLLNVGDAYKKAGAGAEGDKIINDAVGRGGKVLIPILEQTRDRLNEIEDAAKRHGEIFSQQDLENTKAFHIAVKEAGSAVEGLALPIGSLLVPILTGFADVGAKAADVIHSIAHEAHGLLPVIGLTAVAVGVATGGISILIGALAAGAAGLYAMGKAHIDDKDAAEADGKAQAEFSKQVDDTEKSVMSVLNAQRSLASAERTVATAVREHHDAEADLAALLKKGAVDAQKVADDRQKLAGANDALNKSMRDLNDATQKYAALVAKGAVDEKAVTAAREQNEQANRRVADSTYALGDAQKALDKLLADGAVDEKAVTAARRSLDEANHTVESTTRSLADAQSALSTLLAAGAVDAKAVETARRSMVSTDRSAAAATRDLSKAQSDLNALLAGPSAEDAEKAALSVAEAINAQAEAEQRLRTANALAAQARSEGVSGDVLAKILLDQSNAGIAARRASLALTDAQAAQQKLQTDALPTSQAYQDATDKVSDANVRLTDALASQQDAHDALAKAQAGDPAFDKKVADAKQRVADETYSLGRAQADARTSAENLRLALAGDPEFLDKVEKARHAVSTATQNVADAQRDAKKSKEELDVALGGDPAFQQKIEEARQGVADATKAMRDRAHDVGDAEGDLQRALSGDPAFQKTVRDARQKVADSTQAIADAQWAVTNAKFSLWTAEEKAQVSDAPGVIDAVTAALARLGIQKRLTDSALAAISHISLPTVPTSPSTGGSGGSYTPRPGPTPDSSSYSDGTPKPPGVRGGPINPVSPPSTEGYFSQPRADPFYAGPAEQWSISPADAAKFDVDQAIADAQRWALQNKQLQDVLKHGAPGGTIFGFGGTDFYDSGSTIGGNGNRLYDSGGILPPGVTMAENRSGHNEHVLTDEQLSRRGGGGPHYHFHIGTVTTQAKSTADLVKDLVNYSKRNGPLQITVQSGS